MKHTAEQSMTLYVLSAALLSVYFSQLVVPALCVQLHHDLLLNCMQKLSR